MTYLEVKLLLENIVQESTVLACAGLVDTVVRAHDTSDTGLDGFSERPQLKLVEGAVVLVGGVRLATTSTTVVLLLVQGEVLGAGNDTFGLDTENVLGGVDTGEEGVGTGAFPVTTTSSVPAQVHLLQTRRSASRKSLLYNAS